MSHLISENMGADTGRAIMLDDVKENRDVQTFIQAADEYLAAVGYTEHGRRHAQVVAHNSAKILEELSHPERRCQLAAIAGYIHDIGNLVNRNDHAHTSAVLALDILRIMGMDVAEIAVVMTAIGNHDEETGEPVNDVSAALILADKADVHRSRVRNTAMIAFDIHDRVNYAAVASHLSVDPENKLILLDLTIDTEISSLMDYFEIFMSRMLISRKAARLLGCTFALTINGVKFL